MRNVAVLLFLFILSVPARARDLTRYAIVLPAPAAAAAVSRSDSAAMAGARGAVRRSHESLKAELNARGIRITGETDTVLNAVFVAADPSQVSQLRALAGSGFVAKMPRFHRELDAAEQLINVPAAWGLLGGTGNAGAGIKIGIVDTGIDSTHPAFQDASLTPPPGFPVCDVPANCAFTNSKIIVARSYVSLVAAGSGSTPANDSRPDDYSARDRVGHGTAVSMAAAGVTNSGPSDTITGVAPKAFLGNYKVFGSPGVNDTTSGDAIIAALEDAFNDQMDIVSLSIGGPAVFGPLDTGATCGLLRGQPCDVIAFTVQNLVSRGLIVVIAAGNGGASGSVQPTPGTISSPGDTPAAIAVAAITNGHNFSNPLTVPGLNTYPSLLGGGPVPATGFTGPLSDIASVGDPQGCTAPAPNSLAGTIALVQRGVCTFVVKVQNLQTAGAIGAIITNNPGDNSVTTPGGLSGTTTIPATFIGFDDGQAIRAWLKSNPTATVSINPVPIAFSVSTGDQVANFSSRGPVLGGALKPDIAAAGTDLYLAAQHYDPNGDLYSANSYIISQGTSFSTPQIAGIAALVKQAHPSFTPAQVKSAVVNTATADVADGASLASVLSVGGGRANAANAVATNLVVTDPLTGASSVSFGIVGASTLPVTEQFQLKNTGTAPLNLTLAINRRTAENNAHISIDHPNLTIQSNQTATLGVTLSGTVPTPGVYEGFITIQGAANPVQLPFAYLVGDGVSADIVSIAGDGDSGIVGQQNSEGLLLFQVLDRYGVPVPRLPVTFSVTSGGGTLDTPDPTTDSNGFASAGDTLGPSPGNNVFTATAGGLTTRFTIAGVLQPVISANGAVNAADFSPVLGASPGSYISLFGNHFGVPPQGFTTPYLPVSINGLTVSFDTPTLSLPGHLSYASDTQVNVEVPWELQKALQAGQTAVQMKVSSGSTSGALYNLPLATYSPAFFQNAAAFAAALDQNNNVVTTSNPVAQGTVVQLFLNGLGPVSNQPASGDPAGFPPALPQTLATPVVNIGGQNAVLSYSGLAPGNIGLYQINALVPNTGAGLQTLTVSIGGVQSSISHIQVK